MKTYLNSTVVLQQAVRDLAAGRSGGSGIEAAYRAVFQDHERSMDADELVRQLAWMGAAAEIEYDYVVRLRAIRGGRRA